MKIKAFFPCAGGSNLILGIDRENLNPSDISFQEHPPPIRHIQSVTL